MLSEDRFWLPLVMLVAGFVVAAYAFTDCGSPTRHCNDIEDTQERADCIADAGAEAYDDR